MAKLITSFFNKIYNRWLIISIILVFMASGCLLGNREGSISGTVVNSAGDAVSDVALSISSSSANVSATSDGSGYFILSGLKVSSYDIVMKKTGYATTTTTVELSDPGTLSCATPTKSAKLTLPLALAGITGLIYDANTSAASSGYDFTETSEQAATATTVDSRVVASTSIRCDVFFSYNAAQERRILTSNYASGGIQDLGYRNSLNDVGSAPTTGYTASAVVTAGHCYTIKTLEDYYVKLRAETLTNTKLYFLWSIQPVSGSTQFSPSK